MTDTLTEGIVLPKETAEAVINGAQRLLVQTRPVEKLAESRVLLISEDMALGVVRFGRMGAVSKSKLVSLADRTMLTQKQLNAASKVDKAWGTPPYYVWPVEQVEKFDQPREIVDVQLLLNGVEKKKETDKAHYKKPRKKNALGVDPEGGVHAHALERENKKTKGDGAHLHLFVLPDGGVVVTEEDGEHWHGLDESNSDASNVGESAHTHKVILPDGTELETAEDGEHEHQLLVAHSAIDGTHVHALKLPDGTVLQAKTPGEFWEDSGSPEQAGNDPLPAASVLTKVEPLRLGPVVYTCKDIMVGRTQVVIDAPSPEQIQKAIEDHLGEIAETDDRGPQPGFIEVADLVVQFRSQPRPVSLLEVQKRKDILLDMPPLKEGIGGSGPMRAVIQYHFVGKSATLDMRFQQTDKSLVGWTLALEREGAIREPVDSVEKARAIAGGFSPDGDRFIRPFHSPAKALATAKAEQPILWLDVKGEVTGDGQVGGDDEAGIIVPVDKPMVEFGLQEATLHEYFLVGKSAQTTGIMFFKQMPGSVGAVQADTEASETLEDGDRLWLAWLSQDMLPSVLRRSAVKSGRMPPTGYSGLPVTLERDVPEEFRYWKAEGAEARRIRDALVDERLFTDHNVKIVDGQFRRTASKLFVMPQDTEPDKTPPPPVPIVVNALEKVAKLMLPTTSKVIVLDHTLSDTLKASTLAKDLQALDDDYLVSYPDSHENRVAFSKVGRPFTFAGSPGLLYLSSAALKETDQIVWVDLLEKKQFPAGTLEYSPGHEGDSFIEHATHWVESRGLADEDSDYDGMLGKAVLTMAKTFSDEGHSGMSAHYARAYFNWLCDAWDGMATFMLNEEDAAKAKVALSKSAVAHISELVKASFKASGARDLPIHDGSWDGAAAKKRLFEWAGFDGDSPDSAKVRQAFLAYDSAEPDLKGSYKLPFADIVDGRLMAVTGGLRAAASRLPQTDIPSAVQDSARKVLDAYAKKTEKSWEVSLCKLDPGEEERFVLGIVLEPETTDAQKDIYSADEVRTTAHQFLEDFGNIKLMHRGEPINGKVNILESFIAPVDFEINGETVKKGTWLLAVRIVDDHLWLDVKEGRLTGFSIGGSAVRRPRD